MADLDNLLLLYKPGAEVWCEHAEQVWMPAVIESIKGLSSLLGLSPTSEACTIIVDRRDGEVVLIPIKTKADLPPLQNPKVLADVKDLTELSYLHEAAILENLRHRYADNHDFYSYCGIILIAVNPYSNIRQLYDQAAIRSYRGQSLQNVDPHVYGIAEAALIDLERENRSQTIVVSGESGAGKTISAKYVMSYLAEVSRSEASTTPTATVQSTSTEARVLATEPIFEAFGNAKTIRNNNSSRFGKLIRIEFATSGFASSPSAHVRIIGAKISTYLLEKSRVVGQAHGERGFHIFYQICAASRRAVANSHQPQQVIAAAKGVPATAATTLRSQQQHAVCDAELLSLQLQNPSDNEYLRRSGCYDNADMNDLQGFDALREALSTVGIRNTEQWVIFRIVAAILHLGNVLIDGDKDSSTISGNDSALVKACELLSIDAEKVALACTRKRMLVGIEMTVKPVGIEAAWSSRDAMAKHMYAGLFNWIVLKLRASLGDKNNSAAADGGDDAVQNLFIGILDIYGFETFQTNGFEQLCINFANEHLQQLFVKHVFKLEQAQYAAEGIEWTNIDFSDNTPTINLLEMRLGVFDLLDEECKVPNGNDKNWLTKMENRRHDLCGTVAHKSTLRTPVAVEDKKVSAERLSFSRFQSGRGDSSFVVTHFAGKVEYNVSQFVEKNRDEINVDIVSCLQSSTNALVAEIYDMGEAVDAENDQQQQVLTSSSTNMTPAKGTATRTRVAAPYDTRHTGASPRRSALQMLSANKKRPTVSFQFRQSLQDMMRVLDTTTPHFIRCIKPNDQKKPFMLDNKRAIEQLRACGVLETCRIAAAGFPTRWPFERFVERYRLLAARSVDKLRKMEDQCRCILEVFGKLTASTTPSDKYRIGRTKIFLRAHIVAVLERMRHDKLIASANLLKLVLRGYCARQRYLRLRDAVIQVQSATRGVLARKLRDSLRRTRAATVIQAYVRKYQAQKRYKVLRNVVTAIQARVRGATVRRYYGNIRQNRAATKIQAAWRGYHARKLAALRRKNVIIVQSCVRRFLARRQLRELKKEARNVTHLQTLSKGLENKLFKMQRNFDSREAEQRLEAEREAAEHRAEIERLQREVAAASVSAAQVDKNRLAQMTTENEALLARIAQLQLEVETEKKEKTKLHRKLRRADKVQENGAALQVELERVTKKHERELHDIRSQVECALKARDETLHQVEHMGRRLQAMFEDLDASRVEIRMLTRQLLSEQEARIAANSAEANNNAAEAAKSSSWWSSMFSAPAKHVPAKSTEVVIVPGKEQLEKQSVVDNLLEENANLRTTVSDLRVQLRTAQLNRDQSALLNVTPMPSIRGATADIDDNIDVNSTLPAGASATSARMSSAKLKFSLPDNNTGPYEFADYAEVGDDADTYVVVPQSSSGASGQQSFSGWSSPMSQWDSTSGTLWIPSTAMNSFCHRFTHIDPFTLLYNNTMKNEACGGCNHSLMLLPAGVQAYIIVMALRFYDSEGDATGLQQFVTAYTDALRKSAQTYAADRNVDAGRLMQVIGYYASWYAAQLKLVDLTRQLNSTSSDNYETFDAAEQQIHLQCFKSFDFALQVSQFSIIGSALYCKLCQFMQEALHPYIIPAFIQYNSMSLPVPDYTPKKSDRRVEIDADGGDSSSTLRRRKDKTSRDRHLLEPAAAFELFRHYLNTFYELLARTYRLPHTAINNIFRQLMFFISSTVLNALMISSKYCGEDFGLCMQLNAAALRDWLRTRPALAETRPSIVGRQSVTSTTSNGTLMQANRSDTDTNCSSSTIQYYENIPPESRADTVSVASSSVMTVREYAAAHRASEALEPLLQACTLIIMRKSKSDLSDKLTQWSHLTIAQIERILMLCGIEQFSHGDERAKVVEYVRQRLTEMEAGGQRRYQQPRFLLANDASGNNESSQSVETGSVDGLTINIDTTKILVTPNWMAADDNYANEAVDLLALDLPSEYLHATGIRKF